jgi:putative Mg2+ transporter-C (MgtC) family protein
MQWDLFFDQDLWTKIGLSILCGFIVGTERQIHRKPIDIRTSVLVVMGTMAFIYLGEQLGGEKDTTRVLGQVATGIGFLGAGAIVTRQGLVTGVTSASVVWVLSAIGGAIGFGFYEMGLAFSLVTAFVLSGLHWAEHFAQRVFKIKLPDELRK